MSKSRLAALAFAVVAALGLSVIVAAPASADPVVLLQHDDEHLSITVTRDGANISISATNVGTQIEKLGLGAYLETPAEIDLLWQEGPFADQFAADVDPGQTYEVTAPFWPGTPATIFRERDTAPEEVASFMTDGDWVQLVMAGTAEDPQIRVGPDLRWQDSTAVPGEGILVTAVEVPAVGQVDVVVSSDAQLEIVGDQVVLSPGATARTISTATVSATVVGDGYRVGFTTVAELPEDLPPGDYQVFLTQFGTPLPSYSQHHLTVIAGTAAPASAGTVAITGRARLHDTLTAVTSGWDPAATLVYQWYADGQPIERGFEPTLKLDYYENSKVVTVEVSAWRDGFDRVATLSAPTAPVAHEFFTATPPPTITGTWVVGEKLTAVAPVWTPTTGFTYTWYVDLQPTGVTTRTYKIQPEDLGKQIGVWVSSTRLGYHDTGAASDWNSPVVAAGTLTPPTNIDLPKIAGVPRVGNELTVKTGGWKPSPSYAVQWTLDGAPIPDATGLTLSVPYLVDGVPTLGGQLGATLTVSSPGYQDVVVDLLASGVVAEGVFTPKGTPAIVGTLAVGQTLTADPGVWDPAATLSYQWEIVNVGVASTDPSFVIPPAAQNRKIKLTVTASAPGYVTVARNVVTPIKVP